MSLNKTRTLIVLFLALAVFVSACGGDDDDSSNNATPDDDSASDDDTSDDDTSDDDSSDDDTTDDDSTDDDTSDDDTTDDDTDLGDDILPTQGFLDRQAAYLDYCAANAYPDGGLNAQVCVAYVGATDYNEDTIRDTLNGLDERQGSCDFHINALLRILEFDRANPTLSSDLRDEMVTALLGFKYWLDEPGDDDLQWWSENHQLMYHTGELLAGQLFPDDTFSNSGMTGAEHVAHALGFLNRWLDHRGRFGFAEWHSPVYANITMTGLTNLADFAEDESVAVRAAMLLDTYAFDFACNYFGTEYATTAGRAHGFDDGLHSSTREAAYLLLGLGAPGSIDELSSSNNTATALATSDRYWPPPILEGIANDAADGIEHKSSDSLDLDDAPEFGIGYDGHEDVMLWWGHTGYAAPQTILGTFQFVEDYDMWDGQIWSGLSFLRPLVGSPLLPIVAEWYSPLSRGIVLERASTYVYRTPYYQLAAAQDYKAAQWTGQVMFWMAALSRDAYVYVSYPGGLAEGSDFGGLWTGGWSPRSTVYRNVGVFQYWHPSLFLLDSLLFTNYSHAYFPRDQFDEYTQTSHWTIGRLGDAYVALYSQNPTTWSADNDYELIADAPENVWIVEMGDADTNGSFADFVDDIAAASVTITDDVTYESPSQGTVHVGRDGPMTVDSDPVDLGPYPRWDNAYAHQEFGTNVTPIEFGAQRLELDFATPRRRYWENAGK